MPQRGEGFAKAWLDGCGFDPDARKIIPPTQLKRDRIREALWRELQEWGIGLGEPVPLAVVERAIAEGVQP
jgi:hypothetical protein